MSHDWSDDAFPPGEGGFPLPDWDAIADRVEAQHPPEDWHQAYCELGTKWMERVREVLGGRYAIRESRNFILLSTATDEGQELSYHLARFILRGLHQGGITPREKMDEFFLRAKYDDAGQSAALEVLGVSLGVCVGSLMGEGDWDPVPVGVNPGSAEA